MNALTWIHVTGGCIALVAGTFALAARKGGRAHSGAGAWFVAAMLVLGATASVLAWSGGDSGLGLGGLLTCYFVATSWVTARRRDGTTGRFEVAACALALGAAAAIAWSAGAGASTTPAGTGPLFAFAGICLLAGLGDLRAILLGKLTPARRLSRHLWRMCFAFFIATGSFFLGQQDVLPEPVRGSLLLFLLAFAPVAAMLWWLVRLRFAKTIGRSGLQMAESVSKARVRA